MNRTNKHRDYTQLPNEVFQNQRLTNAERIRYRSLKSLAERMENSDIHPQPERIAQSPTRNVRKNSGRLRVWSDAARDIDARRRVAVEIARKEFDRLFTKPTILTKETKHV
jgi:hypothetical protein